MSQIKGIINESGKLQDPPRKIAISGANNVIRLENKLMGKTLYIFSNYILDEYQQTECNYKPGYDIVDIDKFLFKFMKTYKGQKKIDLFCSMLDYELLDDEYYDRAKYIYMNNVKKLFQFNLLKEKNKIKINPKYPSIRLHYSDILNKLKYDPLLYFYTGNYIYPLLTNGKINSKYRFLNHINILNDLFNVFFSDFKKNVIINKIKKKYTNSNIKKKMNIIFNKYVQQKGEYIIKTIKQIIKLVNKGELNLEKQLLALEDNILLMFTLITDSYFLRRFLDKNYINTAIFYTTPNHFSDVVYLLVKYFDFKITNLYYNKSEQEININKLHPDTYLLSLVEIFTNRDKNNKVIQCVELTDFPENFN